jgi:hypothetical protein
MSKIPVKVEMFDMLSHHKGYKSLAISEAIFEAVRLTQLI